MKFYALGVENGILYHKDSKSFKGNVYAFGSKKERDAFVKKHELHKNILCAKVISSSAAKKFLWVSCIEHINFIESQFFDDKVKLCLAKY